MSRYLVAVCLLVTVGFASKSRAEAFTFPTVETSMTDPIFKSLAAALAFRPMEPASDLGVKWGAYTGVGAVATSTDAVSGILTGMSNSFLPGGEAHVGVGVGKGFTLELGLIPTLSFSGTSFSKYAGAVKWTLNRTVLKKFPASVSVTGSFSRASLDTSQPQSGGTVNVAYGSSVYGLNAQISKYLGWGGFGIEPYLGLGAFGQSSSLSASGTASLFGSSFPAGTTSASGSTFGVSYQAGLLWKLGVFAITAEYSSLFGISSYGGKFSIRL